MSEEALQAYTYRILRYTPNLIRDEWINVGVLLHDPTRNTLRVRMVEEDQAYARLRKLHFGAEETLLRVLQADLELQSEAHDGGAAGFLRHLDETLSNLLQLSPQKAVLSADAEAELDRLYEDHVAPPVYRARGAAETADTRKGIRTHAWEIFKRTGIAGHMRTVRASEYTYPGDPLRIDFGWRSNGTRGFFHSIALGQDPRRAKEFAFTAERIQKREQDCRFAAITEVAPRGDNDRHKFVAQMLDEQKIEIVPVAQLESYVRRLRPLLH